MFKQLVKINVGARNLKRKKNIAFFLFLGPSCELHFFWVVCVLSRFSIGVTSRLCSLAVFFFHSGPFFWGDRGVYLTLSAATAVPRRLCVDASQKKRISRLSQGFKLFDTGETNKGWASKFCVCVVFTLCVKTNDAAISP